MFCWIYKFTDLDGYAHTFWSVNSQSKYRQVKTYECNGKASRLQHSERPVPICMDAVYTENRTANF